MLDNNSPLFDLPDEFQTEVLSIYIEDSTKDLDGIKNAFNSEDWEEARRLSHKLKGACAMIGATNLQVKSKYIEDLIDTNGQPSEKDISELIEFHAEVMLYLKKVVIS